MSVDKISPNQLRRIVNRAEDLRQYAGEIAEYINRDRALAILFLVDPARALEGSGYELSDRAKTALRGRLLGVNRAQRDEYDRIKDRLENGETIGGFAAVQLRARSSSTPAVAVEEHLPESGSPNPLDGYDLILEVAEDAIERIVQLAYEENIIPHRPQIPSELMQGMTGELVLGRPKAVSFASTQPGGIITTLPVAFWIPFIGPHHGDLTLEARLNTDEVSGRPAHFRAELIGDPVLSGSDPVIDLVRGFVQSQRNTIEDYLNELLAKFDVRQALDRLAQSGPLSVAALQVDDLVLKVNGLGSTSAKRSVSICVDFAPHDGSGHLAEVGQFMTEQWAIGANERILRQVFSKWWESEEGKHYHRLNKTKLENFESDDFKQVFDANGSVCITKVWFTCRDGYIDLAVDLTIGDAWWWDVDATVTAKVELGIGPTGTLSARVYDVDASMSCWSKFVIGLTCVAIGVVGGAIIGGIVAAVVGGIVGGVIAGSIAGVTIGIGVGAAVGGLITGIITSVLLAVKMASLNNKLNGLKPIDLLDVRFQWPIPQSTLVLQGYAQWIRLLPGEVLLGGPLVMPPLSEPATTLTLLERQETAQDVALPWNENSQLIKTLGSMGNYIVAITERYRVQPVDLMEQPVTSRWRVDGMAVAETGEEIQLTVVPRLQPDGLYLDKGIRILKADGSLGVPHVTTKYISGQPHEEWIEFALHVTSTDAVGTECEREVFLRMKVLGDRWLDNSYEWFTEGRPLGKTLQLPPGLLSPPVAAEKSVRAESYQNERAAFRRLSLAVQRT